ncbi:MAG: hypothetical protein U0Q22_15420 [Acidimicrobiales bacterium]
MPHHRSARSTAALLALTTASVAAAWTGVATPAGAVAPGGAACTPVTFPPVRLIDFDGYNAKVEYSAAVPVNLPPGTYDVTGTSHDEYPARVTVTQTSEIWDLQFLDASGAVIATSGHTGDLPDRVAVADWAGSLGSVTLTSTATAVRAHHRPDAIADGSADSVVPVAATVCGGDVGPTSIVATTSTTSPPTTAPPTTAPPTTAPPTTAPPTTSPVSSIPASTVPVKVKDETLVRDSTTTTAAPGAQLATTGASSDHMSGAALVLLGSGLLLLGVRARRVLRRS